MSLVPTTGGGVTAAVTAAVPDVVAGTAVAVLAACPDCGVRVGRHYNPARGGMWTCAELAAITAEIRYHSRPGWQRIVRRRPPELGGRS